MRIIFWCHLFFLMPLPVPSCLLHFAAHRTLHSWSGRFFKRGQTWGGSAFQALLGIWGQSSSFNSSQERPSRLPATMQQNSNTIGTEAHKLSSKSSAWLKAWRRVAAPSAPLVFSVKHLAGRGCRTWELADLHYDREVRQAVSDNKTFTSIGQLLGQKSPSLGNQS